jgi:hypothetical protein
LGSISCIGHLVSQITFWAHFNIFGQKKTNKKNILILFLRKLHLQQIQGSLAAKKNFGQHKIMGAKRLKFMIQTRKRAIAAAKPVVDKNVIGKANKLRKHIIIVHPLIVIVNPEVVILFSKETYTKIMFFFFRSH